MAYLIDKKDIPERLRKRFDLRAIESHILWTLPPNVIPVTQVDEALKDYIAKGVGSFSRTNAAGTGSTPCVEAKAKVRRTIFTMDLLRTGGDGTLDEIYISGPAGSYIRLLTQAASAHFQSGLLATPIVLDPGNQLRANIAAISADSTWEARLYYNEVELF